MKSVTRFGVGLIVLGSLAVPGLGRAQEHRLQDGRAQEHRLQDLNSLPSPMEALRDVQNTGRLVFALADANHDGLVSQQEAIDANDLLVGGFFFRADVDGNGVVTEPEAKAVVDKYLDQNPWLRYIVDSLRAQSNAKQTNGQNGTTAQSFQGFMVLIDTNNDKQLQPGELRQIVQTLTQSYFAAADTNRDGQMSPSEVNAAVAGIAKSLAQQSFQQADTDHNGQLNRAEYDKAIIEPANAVFQIIDLNHDGQISQQEADQIGRVVIQQVRRMQPPEPANSPTNLIESGRLPREAGPVPTFTAPNAGGTGAPPSSPR